jgi:hypothetical protein
VRRSPLHGLKQGDEELGRESESISDRVFATGSLRSLILLMTPGNAAQADPVEERGIRCYRMFLRNTEVL